MHVCMRGLILMTRAVMSNIITVLLFTIITFAIICPNIVHGAGMLVCRNTSVNMYIACNVLYLNVPIHILILYGYNECVFDAQWRAICISMYLRRSMRVP